MVVIRVIDVVAFTEGEDIAIQGKKFGVLYRITSFVDSAGARSRSRGAVAGLIGTSAGAVFAVLSLEVFRKSTVELLDV